MRARARQGEGEKPICSSMDQLWVSLQVGGGPIGDDGRELWAFLHEPPTGPGVRVDGFGYAGYRTSPSFDSLLAKLIVRTPSGGYAAAVGPRLRSSYVLDVADKWTFAPGWNVPRPPRRG